MTSSILEKIAERGIVLAGKGAGKLIKKVGPEWSDRIVDKIGKGAEELLGTNDPDEIDEALAANPHLRIELETKALEVAAQEYEAMLKDVQNARQRDIEYLRAGRKNTRADIMAYGALFLSFVTLCGLIFMAIAGIEIGGPLLALISAQFGAMGGYTGAVFQYEFGSSAGSKSKDNDKQTTTSDLIKLVKNGRNGI